MKRLSLLILFIIFIGSKAWAASPSCIVTSETDSEQSGSLRYAAHFCRDTITFRNVSRVRLDDVLRLSRYGGVTIDGEDNVTIVAGNIGPTAPLIHIRNSNITVKNIAIEHRGSGICIKTESSNSRIDHATLKNCSTGVLVSNTALAFIEKNIYEDVFRPIELINGNFNPTAPSSLDALFDGRSRWTLTGSGIGERVIEIEIYISEESNLIYLTSLSAGELEIENSDFQKTFRFNQLQPSNQYKLLFHWSQQGSSELSELITPILQEDFLNPEQEACIDTEWFVQGGFSGDADDDQLENGEEDENNNCIVDEFESDPTLRDTDGDGVFDSRDNCPTVPNDTQRDRDNDGIGDACEVRSDEDADGDGIVDIEDNCPSVANRDQLDFDEDNRGDACDDDDDGDGIPDVSDPCPLDPEDGCNEMDSDGDGIPDRRDNCPNIANLNQGNVDGDSFGDLCDPDIDNDGEPNETDVCPRDPRNLCSANVTPIRDFPSIDEGCNLIAGTKMKPNYFTIISFIIMTAGGLVIRIRRYE